MASRSPSNPSTCLLSAHSVTGTKERRVDGMPHRMKIGCRTNHRVHARRRGKSRGIFVNGVDQRVEPAVKR